MIAWAVDAVLATALLMAAVLLLRAPVRRLFGPGVAYALWAVPALRLVLPPLPESWREAAPTPISQASEFVVLAVAPVAEQAAAASTGVDLVAFAALAWGAGAALFLGFHLVQYAAFRTRLLREHRPVERIGGVRVVSSPRATGPLAFGVVSRYVALPADLDARYDADEQALALAHELGHHARGDLAANWLALAMLALHWWNPIAWMAHRAFRADQELANDARVLRAYGPAAAHAYACAILKAAHGGAPWPSSGAAACHLHTIDDLKGRLRMLKSAPVSARRVAAGVASVSLLAAASLGLTASGATAAAAVKDKVGETIGVDLDRAVASAEVAVEEALPQLVAPPAPPAPPVPPAPQVAPAPVPAPVALVDAQVPPAPPAPATAPLPPSPPMPPMPHAPGANPFAIVTDKDGKVTRRYVIRRDGRTPSVMHVPDIREMRCPGDDKRPVIRHERKGDKRITVICTNRIDHLAERSARMAERHAELAARSPEIHREALEGALRGLVGARASIENNPHLTADQKREALQGIEQGEREIRSNLDRRD